MNTVILNQLKKVLLLSVLALSLTTGLYAQKQRNIVKVGCVDIQKIVDKVVADRTLRTVLENKNSDFLKKAEQWASEIKKQQLILENEQGSLPEERLEAIREEIIAKKAPLNLPPSNSHLNPSEISLQIPMPLVFKPWIVACMIR